MSPKRIWITGASSGIGKALALHYAAPGVFLALSGRNEQRLKDVAEGCEKRGAKTEIKILDVTDQQAMIEYGASLGRETPLDLVIANAGISGGTGADLRGEPISQTREIFDINLTGVLNTVEGVLPDMVKAGRGQIAIMSSLAGFAGWPGAPAYSASKGAVRLYGEALRGSVRKAGVRVNVICPGFIRTPMTDVNPYTMPFLMDVEKAARIIARELDKNTPRIAFPWPTYLVAGMLGLLPGWLIQAVLTRFPSKPKQ